MVEAAPQDSHNEPDLGQTADGGNVVEPNVYEAEGEQGDRADLFADQRSLDFSVRDPQDHGGHIVYVVKGKDSQGEFEVKRRYNEFYLLQDCLQKRWPGILLPQVPPKKAMGNKDIVFLQERRFYLERFLRKLSAFDFIIDGEEFQVFARPQGLDVEKSLGRLVKMSSTQLFDRLARATNVDIETMTQQERNILDAQLLEFQVFVKKATTFLKKMKNDIAGYLTDKQMLIKGYAGTAASLAAYEDNNLNYYVESDPSKLVVNNMEQGNLIESLRHTVENLRNPFTDLYHWVKGEIYDLAAFQAALNELKNAANAVESVKKKIAQAKADVENITTGKKTMNTLFKNSGDVHTIQNKLEGYEREKEALEKLHALTLIHLGKNVLGKFKSQKLRLYSRIIQQFHVIEINNSHQLASFWSTVMKLPNVQSANLVSAE